MRQPDAANRLERWSVGCGLFESRRRSLGAMGLGEPWVSHRAAAAETDQCGDRWGQGGGLLPACRYEQPRQTATHPNRTGPAPLVPAQPSRHVKGSDVMIQSERWVGGAWRRCVGSERQTPTEARQMKDFAGTIAVVTGGGSVWGGSSVTRTFREGPRVSRLGPSQMEVRRTPTRPDLLTSGNSNPRSRIGAKLARKQFLHGPVGWSIAESVQAAAAESAILIGRNAHGRLRATPPPSANPDRIAGCTRRYDRAASD